MTILLRYFYYAKQTISKVNTFYNLNCEKLKNESRFLLNAFSKKILILVCF